MALRQDITEADQVFMGEDKKLRFKVSDEDGVTPLDVDGFDFRWSLSEDPSDVTPKVEKTSEANEIRVAGVFNGASQALNGQYVEVDLNGEDTEPLYAGKFKHALRRTDSGSRAVLAFGDLILQQASR